MKRTPFRNMNAKELDEATKRFDDADVLSESRPLSSAEAARWRRARKKPGRPRVGKGAQRISVSIERSLLKRADSFAKRKKLSRSRLLADLLTSALEREITRSES